MIHIKIDDKSISVQGHANDAKHPRNVDTIRACEVITFEVQVLIASIHKMTDDKPFFELHSGEFYMSTTGLSDVSRTLVNSFVEGAKIASTAYADYITVSAP